MRHSQLLSRVSSLSSRRCFATTCIRSRAFKESDIVLLKDKKNAAHEGTLLKLQRNKTLHSHRGPISHDDIIGKEPRQIVQSTKGISFRIHEPTLAEYVRLTPRIVTPIYPSDANLIVSLLDIHVDTPSGTPDGPPMEILEAGTGHGALTLHLSRAIHAANPPIPRTPSPSSCSVEDIEDAVYEGATVSDLENVGIETWKKDRRAILHTLDISSKHSKHAEKIVAGFRKGMYAGNVDFHVGDVSSWIAEQKAWRNTEDTFLSHVFLDLPSADSHLANVASVLNVNGILAVFNPSITQIVDCVEAIRKHRMPYLLDRVIELGASTIREWDVRAVRPRASLKKAEVEQEQSSSEGPIDPDKGQEARDDELAEDVARSEEKWATVCRPKVAQQVVGGGFLGVWRRMERASTAEVQSEA